MQRYLEQNFFANNRLVAFRISRVPNLSLPRIFSELKDTYPYLLVSAEGENDSFHIHGVVASPTIVPLDVREKLKELYPLAIGNRCLYTRESRNVKQLMKYTLKENNYLYQGFNDTTIKNLQRCSSTKERLKEKLIELEENLLCEQISFRNFAISYVEILVSHNQNIRETQLRSYFTKMQMKCGDLEISSYVTNKFLDYF